MEKVKIFLAKYKTYVVARHFSFLDSCNNYFSSKDRTNEEMFFQKNYIIPELNKRNK